MEIKELTLKEQMDLLRVWTLKLAKADAAIKEGEVIKEQAKAMTLSLLDQLDQKEIKFQDVGTIQKRQSSGSRISDEKLKQRLLLESIDPAKIQEIIADCSRSWTTPFVLLVPFKEKK